VLLRRALRQQLLHHGERAFRPVDRLAHLRRRLGEPLQLLGVVPALADELLAQSAAHAPRAATPPRHREQLSIPAVQKCDLPCEACLERDDFSFARHPALAYCWSMIFSENRCPLFGIML